MTEKSNWLDVREKGGVIGVRWVVGLATSFGRGTARAFLAALAVYYVAFHGRVRRASRAYLGRIHPTVTLGMVYQHLLRFAHCSKDVTRIVVTHHAFDTPDPVAGAIAVHKVVGRADMAMAGFLRADVDIIMSGHLHKSGVGETTKRYPLPGRAALLIRAGTATSTRQRGEVNAFNIVRIARPDIAIDCMVWQPDDGLFVAASTERFRRTEAGWSRIGSP